MLPPPPRIITAAIAAADTAIAAPITTPYRRPPVGAATGAGIPCPVDADSVVGTAAAGNTALRSTLVDSPDCTRAMRWACCCAPGGPNGTSAAASSAIEP